MSSVTEKTGQRSTLRFYEAWEDEPGIVKTRSGVVPYEKLDDWLNSKGTYSSIYDTSSAAHVSQQIIIRIITCDSTYPSFGLGCGEDAFDRIRAAFELHFTTEESLLSNNGVFCKYTKRNRQSHEQDHFSMVFKVPNSVNISCNSVSLTFDRKTSTTRAFLHGLDSSDHEQLLAYLEESRDISFFTHPLMLPAYNLNNHRKRTEAYRRKIDKSVYEIECEIGYAIPGKLIPKHSRRRQTEDETYENMDFEHLVRSLHSYQTELFALSYVANFGRDFGVFLRNTERELLDNHFMPTGGEAIDAADRIVHQIDFATNMYRTIASQSTVLKDRVQSHINLTFSLIAQEDNKHSYAMAEQNANIAVSSKRDSAAMKTIAVLTMTFLPPTFVATLFGMDMIDWTPEASESGISSPYFWIYWAVTIPVTIIVLLIWRIWWKLYEQKNGQELHRSQANIDSTTDFNDFVNMTKSRTRQWSLPALFRRPSENANSANTTVASAVSYSSSRWV